MEVSERFVALVSRPGEVPLDEAALLIAAHADRRVDIQACRAQLDELAARCVEGDEASVRALLFGELWFRGNADDYYHPDNSYLDKVLTRRVGLPISLSVLLMEVGRRAGVDFVGIGAPGHFLVRLRHDADHFVDAFGGGRVLTRAGALAAVGTGGLLPGADPLPPVDHRMILLRMLTNLKAIYAQRGDPVSLAWVLTLRLALPGVDQAAERTELAKIRAHFN